MEKPGQGGSNEVQIQGFMAVLHIPDQKRTMNEFSEIKEYLAGIGIGYEIWKPSIEIDRDSSNEQILEAFASEI